ncbi:MAG TPA: type II toxin-antitoxin system RelE/ParE family toxin [Pyrinomonadaceae bacterium]|jgi:mRNA interferase RelE/StbE
MSSAPYAIFVTKSARRDLSKLDPPTSRRIAPVIDALAQDPRPAGCLSVKSEPGVWRVRVGDWRVGYRIDDAAREVTVIRVGHRSEFYD